MREKLAYTVKINRIEAIKGADRVEMAYVHNWGVMVKKGEFVVGDLVAYFEIDSKLDKDNPVFEFMKDYGYKVKSRKFFKGTVISQGLIVSLKDLGLNYKEEDIDITKELKVTNIEMENEKRHQGWERKVRIVSAYPYLWKNKFLRKIVFRSAISDIIQKPIDKLIKFFKKWKEASDSFPECYAEIHKSDEERCENLDWQELKNRGLVFRRSCKVDGTSATYIYDNKKKEFIVCSRSIRQLDAIKFDPRYFGFNVYWMMAEKYNIEKLLKELCENQGLDYACMQGEIAGLEVQDNRHKLDDIRFFMFNLILGSVEQYIKGYRRIDVQEFDKKNIGDIEESLRDIKENIECVPTIDLEYKLPEDFNEFKKSAEGECDVSNSKGQREGIVYKAWDKNGELIISFKNINNQYLIDNNL